MMCQKCGHPLDKHYSWSAGGVSGAECSACLYVSKGVYAKTRNSCIFVPPAGYSVTSVAVGKKGVRLALVLTSSLVTP